MPHHRSLLMISLALTLTLGFPGIATANLKILLTNDDGYTAIGIRTLREALEEAGHEVIMVAPMVNNSGASAGLTNAPVAFQQIDPTGYWVDGTPATCVFAGLTLMSPDLIVSGTNLGSNLGRTVTFSGTDGAAFTALFNDLPAVAFSTDDPSAGKLEHYTNVARFAAALVQALEESAGGGELLPPGTFLNVNYPLLPPALVQGVRFTVQNMEPSSLTLSYVPDSEYPGYLFPVLGEREVPPPPRGTDQAEYDAGWIALTLMSADYTVSSQLMRPRTRKLLRNLEP